MPLPKIHPLRKTYIDLRRCTARLNEFIAQFDEEKTNESDLYLELLSEIEQLMDKIPDEYCN